MKTRLLLASVALYASQLAAQVANPPTIPKRTPSSPQDRWQDFYAKAAPAPPQSQADPFMRFLFPPELVMAHQREIGLQDAQRTKLVAAMNTAQAKFTESQWTLSGEQDKLQQLVQATTVDEAAVQKQLDRILAMEDDLKRTQLLLMVRVKNVLTPEQQSMLAGFRGTPCQPQPKPAGGRGVDPDKAGATAGPTLKYQTIRPFEPVAPAGASQPCGPGRRGPGDDIPPGSR